MSHLCGKADTLVQTLHSSCDETQRNQAHAALLSVQGLLKVLAQRLLLQDSSMTFTVKPSNAVGGLYASVLATEVLTSQRKCKGTLASLDVSASYRPVRGIEVAAGPAAACSSECLQTHTHAHSLCPGHVGQGRWGLPPSALRAY